MPLIIKRTGLEQYAAGGEGRLKMLIIGGPGAGKSRMSSFWPKPFYANCEAGLASIADRGMPYSDVNSSQDLLDVLAYMKVECTRPYRDREYQTLVVDTIDAFSRKVKDEWLRANPGAQSFRGFDAYGYLETKMQMLLTRMLNLDMNVIVLAHYKDKTIREGAGETATERQELMLQLVGDVKDSIFNDFDLVGWLGTWWAVEDGQRVEKRGLTFKRTPEKPFLKDRLFVTPEWMEVNFSDEDYVKLFSAVIGRLDELKPSEEIGEIPSAVPEEMRPSAGVVGPRSGGALPPQDPADIPLVQFDKPTLQKMARDLGIDFKANTVKAELIEAIEIKRLEAEADEVVEAIEAKGAAAEPAQGPVVFGDQPVTSDAPDESPPAADSVTPEDASATPVASAQPAVGVPATTTGGGQPAPQGPPAAIEDIAAATLDQPTADPALTRTEAGLVDADGVLTPDQVATTLGGVVTSTVPTVETLRVEEQSVAQTVPQPAVGDRPEFCEWPTGCEVKLATQVKDYVTLSGIRYRKFTCNSHFDEANRLGLKPGLVGLPSA